jgi:hypothetical protein
VKAKNPVLSKEKPRENRPENLPVKNYYLKLKKESKS